MIDDFRPGRAKSLATKIKLEEPVIEEPVEPTFRPPEEVASDDELLKGNPEPKMSGEDIKDKKAEPAADPSKKKRKFKLTKKQAIIFGVVAALLVSGGVVAALKLRKKPAPAPVPIAKEEPKPEPPKPTTEASRLTGVQVSFEANKLPTTGIMIENSPDARPQAGIIEAGVVFEAIAEGGITRFLTIFQEGQPDYIGPVRSVRPYYLDWVTPFDAPLAHAGGSGEALAQIRNEGLKDLDHGPNGGAYQRVSNRFAPHNLYTSRQKLLELQNSKGFGTSTFNGFVRKAEAPVTAPTIRNISIGLSSFLYNPVFAYDQATNSYKRSQGGAPHTDERSGKQLSPKVVVVMFMNYSQQGIYSVYQTNGSGRAIIFQDGAVIDGIWEKTSRSSQIKFGDANGLPIGLNPGQTWVVAANTANQASVVFGP